MGHITWTAEMDRSLAARYVAGESVDAIAIAMTKTPKSIVTRISTLGLLRRKTRRGCPAGNGNAIWIAASGRFSQI